MSSKIWQSLLDSLPSNRRKLERRVLEALGAEFNSWYAARQELEELLNEPGTGSFSVIDFLGQVIQDENRRIDEKRLLHSRFLAKFSQAGSLEERHQLLLDHSRDLGANRAQVLGDQAALKRWFGADTLTDRVQTQVAAGERRIAVALYLLGRQARSVVEEADRDKVEAIWSRLEVEAKARLLFSYEGHPRIKLAAFDCLAEALKGLPADLQLDAIDAGTVQFIYRSALDTRQYVWLQVEALELLRCVAPASCLDVVKLRLSRREAGDDMFVRRRALLLAAEMSASQTAAGEILTIALTDSSDFVRQGLALALCKAPAKVAAHCLPILLKDTVPQVRAQALVVLVRLFKHLPESLLLNGLAETLAGESDTFVLRTALFVTGETLAQCSAAQPAKTPEWLRIHQFVSHLHETAADLKVRRWAAETLGRFRLQEDGSLQELVHELGLVIAACPPGQSQRLPGKFDAVSADQLGYAALFLVQADFPLDFERRFGHWHVQRGHRFGFRLWRWLHEFRNPSPDKRQAFSHTIGRIFRGNLRVPSPILAELAATKVPGEPLHLSSEAGWRPYLPLVDELISSLDLPAKQHPLRLFTHEGITEVAPPRSLLRRLLMRARLTLQFPVLAQARNWQEGSPQAPAQYVRRLQEMGFSVRFVPYPGASADAAVTRFFPLGVAWETQGDEILHRLQNYFFSVYGNTLLELTVLISAALIAFVIRHALSNLSMRRARVDIPLVVGGWGTRGKSGTERLKAGLFNGLGYSVVSKTTGCEAMFLHSHPYQSLREMFLFRPYDKATIWEQHNVTRIASALKADVMLWECMALTPAFVELLQQRWMRDDISTITNTFPDHEDLQGPAGINIPEVMTRFIPRNTTLLTSEEQMRPILSTAAARLGTQVHGVGWLESGLLTSDVLARFPYQEHPDNIALVARMAAELDIAEDYALKEMADRVVPDLGVLKVYPLATVNGRYLSFANGMSANERFGCLGNWYRLGFDRIDVDAEPGTFISTVVNNRADRIARSRVFASILVNDITADQHFLIGSNLNGLLGYIKEAWDKQVADLSLWPQSGESPLSVFESAARRLRIPYNEKRLRARLAAMLAAKEEQATPEVLDLCNNPTALATALTECKFPREIEVVTFMSEAKLCQTEYDDFCARLRSAGTVRDANLDLAFRQLLWQWFERKLVVVADYYASGNQICQLIAERTPPGFLNRIMGIQNIKGTGLDFIYRWQAWASCHAACADLRASDSASYKRGLTTLTGFQEFGVLSEVHVLETLAIARQSIHGQLAIAQSQLNQCAANLTEAMRAVHDQLKATRAQGWLERLVSSVEGFVDAGDAVRRRRVANQIYVDLISQRISHARAAIELLSLTQQQKGGWLFDRLRNQLYYLAESLKQARQSLLEIPRTFRSLLS
ncbi:MAG: hypothetical protein KBH08_00145 [Brachymonas sp.]|nr:hypothetical protein [Brachymonas sp.]